MAKGNNVEVRGLQQFVAVNNLFVSGTLTTSGSVSLGSSIFDVDSDLELSSSAGSIVALSASLDFPNADKPYHIRARNNHLILSSSAGSIIAASGSLSASNLGVFPSGYLSMPGTSRGARLTNLGNQNTISGLLIQDHSGGPNANCMLDGQYLVGDGAGAAREMSFGRNSIGNNNTVGGGQSGLGLSSNYSIRWTGGTALGGAASSFLILGRHDSGSLYISGGLGQNALVAKDGDLILSSSASSIVAFSSSVDFQNSDKSYHIRAKGSDLILSSSNSSRIFISGNLSSSDGIWSNGQIQAVGNFRSVADFIGSDPGSSVRNNNNTYWLGADKIEFRRTGKISFDKDTTGAGLGGDEFQIVNAKGFGGATTMPSGTLGLSSSLANTVVNGMTLASLRGGLILSSSEGSQVTVSGNLNVLGTLTATTLPASILSSSTSIIPTSASLEFSEVNKPYHIRSTNNRLILSSSVGASYVAISGALIVTDIPTSDPGVHGAIYSVAGTLHISA